MKHCGYIYFADGSKEKNHECEKPMPASREGWVARFVGIGHVVYVCSDHACLGKDTGRSLDYWLSS